MLDVAEIPGFLGNLNELYEAADSDGQMWREFTGAWWEAYREEPKKVSDLNQFCEERDLMLNVRGDGSARSQQTRLGKALGTKRDRVFNGLTVKRISQGKHKDGVLYALAPANGGKPGGPSSAEPGPPGFARMGTLTPTVGTWWGRCRQTSPFTLSPIDPISLQRRWGRGGRWGPFPGSSREEILSHTRTHIRARAARTYIEGARKTAPTSPTSPPRLVTETKHDNFSQWGRLTPTFPINVSPRSPHREPAARLTWPSCRMTGGSR